MCRNYDHFEAINLFEFKRLGIGSTGHSRQVVIQAEIILEGYGGNRLVFLFNDDAFFSLNCLVQSV